MLRIVLVAWFIMVGPTVFSQTIKLGTLAPDGSPWFESLKDMGESWKKATNGKLKFKMYPGGVVGEEDDMLRKMRIGQLHAAALTGVGLARIIPEINALQMPMLFDSFEELDYVRNQLRPKLEKLIEDKGYVVLNWGDAGWVQLFTQKPVVHPNDLKDQKIFVWSGETVVFSAWKAAGYHPVEIAATDILTSLQTGLINAYTTTPLASLSFQWFALAQNMTKLYWAPLVGATLITKKKWESIPTELRPVLMKASRESGDELKEKIRKLDLEAVEIMKKHGLVVHTVPDNVRAEWKRLTNKYVYDTFLDDLVPRPMFQEVQKLLKEYRAKKDG